MSLILVYIFSLCSEQYQNINTGGNMALRQFLLLFKDNFEKDRKQQTWKKTETQQNVSPIFCALLVHVTPSGQLSHALTTLPQKTPWSGGSSFGHAQEQTVLHKFLFHARHSQHDFQPSLTSHATEALNLSQSVLLRGDNSVKYAFLPQKKLQNNSIHKVLSLAGQGNYR